MGEDKAPKLKLEGVFDAEGVRRIALAEIEQAFHEKKFQPGDEQKGMMDSVMQAIWKQIDPGRFKIMAHCTITEASEGGIEEWCWQYWDRQCDGVAVVVYKDQKIEVHLCIWGIRIDGDAK
jgi:hypothetical protein